jgi:replication fork clamp-binding protein CrfC
MLACFACHSCGFSEHPALCRLALWPVAQVQHLGCVVLTSAQSPDYLRTQYNAFCPVRYQGTNVDISNKELSGGARIFYIFNDVFGHALVIIESTQSLEIQDIHTTIHNSTGPQPSLLVPGVTFNLLVKPQIRLLEAPSLQCVEPVYEKLARSAIITRAQYVR